MLSRKAKYAINSLVVLSKHRKEKCVKTNIISQEGKIPRKFLEQILLDLKKAGYVNSLQGKEGGYFLSSAPEEIDLASIMRLIDGPIALIPCASYKYYKPCEECEDEEYCSIRYYFKKLRDETVRELKSITIADIIKKENNLKRKKVISKNKSIIRKITM